MKIDSFKVGRFEIRDVEDEGIKYFIDGEQVLYPELEWDSSERMTLDVLNEKFDHERHDNGLKWVL